MLPTVNTNIQNLVIDVNQQPSLNYHMVLEKDIVNGKVDRLEAMKQVIYKILNTERYDYVIYSWNYGIELKDLIGQDKSYVVAMLPKKITDALLQDNRIVSVENFEFDTSKKRVVACLFTVNTIYGSTQIESEVNY